MNNQDNGEQNYSFMGQIFNFIKNKALDISTRNINNLLTRYELNINYIKHLHNKIISVNIANQNQIWQFNVQNNILTLHSIVNKEFNEKLINLKIILPLTSLLEIKSDDFLSKVKIDGDANLATNLSKLVQSLNITLEDILSLKLPPTLSYLLSEFIKKQSKIISYSINSFTQHTSDYLLYEKKVVISKLEFEDLYKNISDLRDNTDRVQQKFNKILKAFFNLHK